MANTYHLDPKRGKDHLSGGETEPWSALSVAAGRLQQGDTLHLHDGIYTEPLVIPHPDVTVKALGAGAVIDGSSGRLTGNWSQGGNGIWSRPYSGGAFGCFSDTYETLAGHCVLWNMSTDQHYGSNPNKTFVSPYRSQWKLEEGGTLRVCTNDGKSPDTHDIRVATRRVGLVINGKPNTVIDGVSIRHFAELVNCDNSPGVVFRNLDCRYSGGYGFGVHGSDNAVIEKCILWCGGSMMAHGGQTAYFSNSRGLRMEGCDIRWGGHGGPLTKGLKAFVIRGNYFGKSGGSQLNLQYGTSDGEIEGNVFFGAPFRSEFPIHPQPHAAIQCVGANNSFTGNLIWRCGVGFAFDHYDGHTTEGNVIERNTFWGIEDAAIKFNSRVRYNMVRANILANTRLLVVLDDNVNNWQGNKVEGNLMWDGRLLVFQSGEFDPMAAQQRHPTVISGTHVADPKFTNPGGGDFHSLAPGYGSSITDGNPPDGGVTPTPTPDPDPSPAPGGTVVLDSVTPSVGKYGEIVTFKGKNLGAAAARVIFTDPTSLDGGRRALTVGVSTDTEVKAVVPATAVTGAVWVRNSSIADLERSRSNKLGFTVGTVPPPKPVVPLPPFTTIPLDGSVPLVVGAQYFCLSGGNWEVFRARDAQVLVNDMGSTANVSHFESVWRIG